MAGPWVRRTTLTLVWVASLGICSAWNVVSTSNDTYINQNNTLKTSEEAGGTLGDERARRQACPHRGGRRRRLIDERRRARRVI